jgi:two-component system OmpR family sensor kinase
VLMAGRDIATSWSALLSLVLGGMFFALSGLNFSPALNQRLMRRARTWVLLYLVFWLVYSWSFLVLIPSITAQTQGVAGSAPAVAPTAPASAPRRQPGQPLDDYAADAAPLETGGQLTHPEVHAPATSTPAAAQAAAAPASPLNTTRTLVALLGLLCYAFAAGRHYYLYLRAPSYVGIGITCGIVLLGEALLTQQLSSVYTASFWLYHAQEFAGFGVISHALLVTYHRGDNDGSMLESLFLPGTRAQLQADYAHAMDALVEVLSRGEQPPAALSQRLRGRFGLTESQMRVLSQAALAVSQERQQRQELERLNETLRQLERDKDQLMQMVVHDLKNPLTALIGFLELMRISQLDDDQRTLLESALHSGKNLSSLIGDLLDIARMEEGHLELLHSYFTLPDLFEECAGEMSAWLVQDDKTIRVETPDDLPPAYADLRLVRRILLNLISNAIKHTPPGTRIILRAYSCPTPLSPAAPAEGPLDLSNLVVEVQDDGPGIASEDQERIFAKFGRLNREGSSRQQSTGLGLTFCRLAVEAHGGAIDVTSTIGKGTTFRILLPQPESMPHLS